MIAKQLSIFIENRKGRLTEVLSVLKKNDINMLSLSLADTSEFGLLRLIVDNLRLSSARELRRNPRRALPRREG